MASATGLLTVVCMIAVLFAGQAPFTMAAMAIFGFCTFNATIALIYSARREEFVHRLALDSDTAPKLQLENHGVDGTP